MFLLYIFFFCFCCVGGFSLAFFIGFIVYFFLLFGYFCCVGGPGGIKCLCCVFVVLFISIICFFLLFSLVISFASEILVV